MFGIMAQKQTCGVSGLPKKTFHENSEFFLKLQIIDSTYIYLHNSAMDIQPQFTIDKETDSKCNVMKIQDKN